MHEADTHFLLAFLVSGLLVQDTWSQIVDMDHKSETSFTSCHIYAARIKQKISFLLLWSKNTTVSNLEIVYSCCRRV